MTLNPIQARVNILFFLGSSNILKETFLPNSESVFIQIATAKLYHGQFAYVLESEVRRVAGGCEHKVNFQVFDDDLYRPTITLLDDVTTWRAGACFKIPVAYIIIHINVIKRK